MPKDKILTSIDLGSSKVSTVITSMTDSKISVIGVSGNSLSKGIKKGNVVDIDDCVEAIAQSLEKAERMAGVSVSNAFITINGSHIKTLNSHGVVAVTSQNSEITTEDVYRVTEAAQAVTLSSSQEIIHVIPRGFTVDSQDGIKDPVGMSGVRLEVETNIIYGSASAMKNVARCVDQVSVAINDVVYSALASSEAVLTDTERELGTLLLDIGGGVTSMLAFVEGSPAFSAVVPVGANYITQDLAVGLRTRLLEEAERIKIKLSDSKNMYMTIDNSVGNDFLDVSEFGLEEKSIPKSFLFDVIDARLEEIFKLVGAELQKAQLSSKLPAGVVLTGGGALTAGAEKMVKKVLKLPVRIGYPQGLSGLIDEIRSPAYAASIGCILYGAAALKSGLDLSFDSDKGRMSQTLKKYLVKLKSLLP